MTSRRIASRTRERENMRHFIAGAFVSTGIIASVASAGGSAEGITWFNDKGIWEAAPAVFSFPKSWVTDIVDVAVGKTPEGDHAQLSGGADKHNDCAAPSPVSLHVMIHDVEEGERVSQEKEYFFLCHSTAFYYLM
jgi:hypothetical protein